MRPPRLIPALLAALALAGCHGGGGGGGGGGGAGAGGAGGAGTPPAPRSAANAAGSAPAGPPSAANGRGATPAGSTPTRAGSPPGPSAAVRSRVAQADRTGEYPVTGTVETVFGGWRDPVQAVRVFAATYINWTATTVSARLAALAQVSVGQARSIVSLGASQTARDYELRHGGIANSGTVQAVSPQPGAADRYIVVTREQTTSSNSAAYRGLGPAWHVTLATVTTVDAGDLGRLWVLSGWQPES